MYRQHRSRAEKTRKRLKVTQNLASQCNVCVAIVSKIMYVIMVTRSLTKIINFICS